MTPEIRHLLGGYATGTLTDDERERLFAAALDDQALFDALAEEQPLKDLLDDPESRGYLLAELDQPAQADTPMVAARMSKMARSAPAPTSVSMPPPPAKPTARFWLPFAAVMMALLVTGWFWWKSAPEPNMQVAAVAPKQSHESPSRAGSGAGPRPALIDNMPQGEPAKDKPVPKRTAAPIAISAPAQKSASPDRELADHQGPKHAEVRQELARADAAAPVAAEKLKEADKAKKEIDAMADKASVHQVLAEGTSRPAPASPAASAVGALASSNTQPAYRLLRLVNNQFVPTAANARFQAGDTIVILLPGGDPGGSGRPAPQLALANGSPIALEREGDGYRSARIELATGPQEFIVTPDNSPTVRSGFAAGQEAKANIRQPLRIRLTVE